MSLPDRIYWRRGHYFDVKLEERGADVRYSAHPRGSIPLLAEVELPNGELVTAHMVGADHIVSGGHWYFLGGPL